MVRNESDFGSVFILIFYFFVILKNISPWKLGRFWFSISYRFYLEIIWKSIHCFCSDTIEPYRLFECLGIVFSAGIHFGNRIYHFAERNPSPEVPDGHFAVIYADFYFISGFHSEFINRVVQDFFQQNVYSVIRRGTIA